MNTTTPLSAATNGRSPLKMLHRVVRQQRLDNDEKAPADHGRGVVSMLNVAQAARRAKVGGRKVYGWIKSGALHAVNVGDLDGSPRWRIDPKELELFLRDRTAFMRQVGLKRLPR